MEPTEEQLKASETLRDALVNPSFLALPKLVLSIMLDIDASHYQIGLEFLQMAHPKVPKLWEPIVFWSKKLKLAESN